MTNMKEYFKKIINEKINLLLVEQSEKYTFKQFQDELKKIDWYSEMSDDYRVISSGDRHAQLIDKMARYLVTIDPQKTAKLYNFYGKKGLGNKWKDVNPKVWIDKNKANLDLENYRKGILEILKKVGSKYGTIKNLDTYNDGKNFYASIRGKGLPDFTLTVYQWMGGSKTGVDHNSNLFVNFDKKYLQPSGVSLKEIEQALEKNAKLFADNQPNKNRSRYYGLRLGDEVEFEYNGKKYKGIVYYLDAMNNNGVSILYNGIITPVVAEQCKLIKKVEDKV